MKLMKREILFIVYKAGWWGCLDSLYYEACQDSNNLCLVMPVPSYPKAADTGKPVKNELLYEFSQLPIGLNVVDYRVYQLKEHCPKQIYIHNPYDNENPFETVDSQYYSQNLKKYTEELIYVPHLLYTEYLPENLRFCSCYQHVDKILLSCEDARYAFDAKYDFKITFAKSGIVQYMDKLAEQKPAIPIEWLKQLTDGEAFGTKKSILFYLAYEDLFNGTEKMLKKLEYVFDYMETRKDIQLVFRPDEEIKANRKQFPPTVVEEYDRIIDRFVEEQIGILDETEDLYIAATLTDAFMGKGTYPIQNLFGIQGKLSLMINGECRPIATEDDLCIPSFRDCAMDGDDIWFVDDMYGYLCKVNMKNGHMKVVEQIPDSIMTWSTYLGIEKINDVIYLAPFNTNNICKYSIKEKIFEKIYLPIEENCAFTGIIRYKDYLFLLPRNYPAIMRFDINTEQIEFYEDWIEQLNQFTIFKNMEEPFFTWGYRQRNNLIYMASSKTNALVIFDMDTGEAKVIHIEDSDIRYIDMEMDEKSICLIPYDGNKVYSYVWENEKLLKIMERERLDNFSIPYERLLRLQNNFFLFPRQEKSVCCISASENCIMNIQELSNESQSEYMKERKLGYSIAKKIENGEVLLYRQSDGHFILVNETMRLQKEIVVRFPREQMLNIAEKRWRSLFINNCWTGFINESQTILLMILMLLFMSEQNYCQQIKKTYREQIIGDNIHGDAGQFK